MKPAKEKPRAKPKKNKVITVPMDEVLHRAIKDSAEREGRSILGQIRYILSLYLKLK